MKRILFIISAYLFCHIALYGQESEGERVFLQLKDLVETEKFSEAKELYLSKKTILDDNGDLGIFSSYLFSVVLLADRDVEGALSAIAKSTKILDNNYADVVDLKNVDYIIPYYFHALLASRGNKSNAITLYRKAKQAYEDAGLQEEATYYRLVEELADLDSAKELTRINNILQTIKQDAVKQNYQAALVKINEALALTNKMPTQIKALYASVYYVKGRVYWALGNLNEAEKAYLTALQYIDSNPKSKEIELKIYTDLGGVYGAVNDYERAHTVLQQVKLAYEEKGDLGQEYARCIANLAVIFAGRGDALKASIYYETALDIYSKTEEVNKLEIASMFASLITCYMELCNYEEAEDAANRAMEALPKEGVSPIFAQVYNNVGTVYLNQKRWDQAYEAFAKAVLMGGNSPLSPVYHFNLVVTQYMKQDSSYMHNIAAFSDLLKREVLSNFLFLSDDQRFSYWDYTGSILVGYDRLLLNSTKETDTKTLYNNTLFSKGLLLRASNWMSNQIQKSGTTSDKERLSLIGQYKQDISSGAVPTDSVSHYQDLIMNLEKELLRDNISFSNLQKSFLIDWKMIQQKLRKDEVAIEFAQVPILKEMEFSAKKEYIALLIRKSSKSPELIRICHEDSLHTILQLPQQLARINDETVRNEHYRSYLYGNGQYRYSMGTRRVKLETKGEALYDLLWAKIEPKLAGISRIYYSPIGTLNNISFNALSKDSVAISERYDLRLVSSTATLVLDKKREKLKDGWRYGGIKYDAEEDQLVAESRSYARNELTASRGIDLSKANRAGWGFLQGTLEESEMVSQKLDSTGIRSLLLTDVSANEESFKSMDGNSPSLIHIATHGFFLSEEKDRETKDFIQTANLRVSDYQSSMNYSGLLFAGGNRAWTGVDVIDGIEDGILTANEISNMNLSNTDIAVLSACETGLGSDMSSEGVFGLQRAFKLAGVQTLIMSLWKVPDEATSKLMQVFYDNWLSGMDKHQAFSQAQRLIKEIYHEPYYWAGFVMLD